MTLDLAIGVVAATLDGDVLLGRLIPPVVEALVPLTLSALFVLLIPVDTASGFIFAARKSRCISSIDRLSQPALPGANFLSSSTAAAPFFPGAENFFDVAGI